jgi:hypothetical protein
MSAAGKPIAHEFGLSRVALGYLLCPDDAPWRAGGRLIDRSGTHVMASIATL